MSSREIIDFYERTYDEAARLTTGGNNIERLRTMDVLDRFLPEGNLRIADVGGGPGVYAQWLAQANHEVHLSDPVPRHVNEASELDSGAGSITATVGDARQIDAPDDHFDAVLMLGPLYHLQDRQDRLQAWREAKRVCRPAGLIAAATISRFGSFHDMLWQGRLGSPEIQDMTAADLDTGLHSSPDAEQGCFTVAYFHHPDEIADEVADAGLTLESIIGLEGISALVPGIEQQLEDPSARQFILATLRDLETDRTLLGASSHLLTLARPGS